MKNPEEINEVQEPDLSGNYTARDYISWKTEELMELIRGKIFKMSPAPARRHQRVSGKLNLVLEGYFEQPCEVYYAGAPDLIVEILSPETAAKASA